MAGNNLAELIPIAIEDEMRKSYLDYAMSVIVSRAIPDARDGLKPVHRRILYAMLESGCDFNKAYKKSARIVGEVMGKYHPHGDSAIYDALVRMAQDFSMRVPLVDGQGNFGSMDGDSPAAMRYTESRLEKVAHKLLEDIDKETVGWQENYDGSEQEPVVLPAMFPNLLVNGAGGIAVGMATNIPTHNLGEVIDATCLLIDHPHAEMDEILKVIPGPDFPTGGLILGRAGSYSAMTTGRGSVIMRGKAEVTEIRSGKEAIVITEIPYQVNKARMIEKIAELVKEKRIEGITDVRDESNKEGVRVVVELRRDAVGDVVLNQLYKYTPLQTSFGVNMLALDRGRPALMNVRDVLKSFITFREEVITKRTIFELGKARDRAHTLIGLVIAVSNIDEVIKLIRGSADANEARDKLLERAWPAGDVEPLLKLVDDYRNQIENGKVKLTEEQVKAILEMRLQRLTGLERNKLDEELGTIAEEIKDCLETLGSYEKLKGIMRAELIAIRDEFATPRATQISDAEFEMDDESLIPREDMVVTVTVGGYIKRTPLAEFRSQKRGGKGKSGINMKDEDATADIFVANTHTPVLFFSTTGKVYKLKGYRLPLGNAQARGRALVNIFPMAENETICCVMPMPEDEAAWDSLHIFFATRSGNVRRNDLSDFKSIMANGKIAMKLDEGDKLIGVHSCTEKDHILLAAYSGKCIRFPVDAVRVFRSRTSDGVRGMKLDAKDYVISMTVLNGIEAEKEQRDLYLKIAVETRAAIRAAAKAGDEGKAELAELLKGITTELPLELVVEFAANEEFLLTMTENGYGKRSSAYEYRITGRGGSGITNIDTSERNGQVVASFPVEQADDIMLTTNKGTMIRCPVKDIRIAGRNTQGVTLFKTGKGEIVASATRIPGGTGEDTPEMAEGAEAATAQPEQDAANEA